MTGPSRCSSQSMKHKLFVGAAALIVAVASAAQTWATATAKHPGRDRVIVYRFLDELPSGVDKTAQPDRFIVSWRFEGERGMPAPAVRQQMDAMEDAIEAMDVGGQTATLAVVSTGDNLRQWVYYVKSRQDFTARLNRARVAMRALHSNCVLSRTPAGKRTNHSRRPSRSERTGSAAAECGQ